MDPEQYPTIEIPSATPGQPPDKYVVKFRVSDLVRLASQGIDLMVATEVKGVEALTRSVKVLCAGIAHQVTLDPEQMYDRVDMLMLPEIAEVIKQAISKVPPQPPAKPETPAVTGPIQ